ncbi:MAG: EutN/CcmL family microcompartment protein [Spirochaetaceae bacterium]
MKLGRVVGRVVSTKKLVCLDGRTLLLVQQVEPDLSPVGRPVVAVDTVKAGEGDLVYFEGGKEAAQSLPDWFNPTDAAVIAVVDSVDVP